MKPLNPLISSDFKPRKGIMSLYHFFGRSIYKDAVFDTNEYPGHRRAEAGNIKKSRAFAVPPVIPAEQ